MAGRRLPCSKVEEHTEYCVPLRDLIVCTEWLLITSENSIVRFRNTQQQQKNVTVLEVSTTLS